ncbi:MAG: hypothetical protein HUJ78_05930 [Mogibacterium sp.]|nr:hypothetical protein [Mogibacterium sp.]
MISAVRVSLISVEGTSDKNLLTYLPDSTWLGSRRFSDKSDVTEWLSEPGIKGIEGNQLKLCRTLYQ